MSNASIQADKERYAQVTRDRAEDEARAEHRARETALAVRRERIMAALMAGNFTFSDVLVARRLADVIMEAAK